MKLKKLVLHSAFALSALTLISTPISAQADMFGGDVAVLMQILANALEQLMQLEQLLSNAEDSLGLLKEINKGINDSLQMAQTHGIHIDPGLYQNITTAKSFVDHLNSSYGTVPISIDQDAQRETDQVAADGIAMNTSLYDYANELDQVGEQIKSYSHAVSPGGAAKLTAQSLGVIVHIMNEQLRATATGIKISSQALAMQNKKEKAETTEYLNQAKTLEAAMQNSQIPFDFPRF